ncbi:FAD-dependent monooxygenase [Streptomyces sp. TRM 70361]|uniref:FAD-dependent monooxygenase n=1 Tax=Streptomyces sp. TRM 70361 TaxID=3116553 RepID=UPI002E7B8835|nr:FAD-dependent monooxygenase [Streptomyces sp. TRM 70361]MEE1939860.1 FAD-dependent monooxygenase [Streptomyces sp. TRM 70361]
MRILVSGAGIAGLAAGINLGATGNDVTIVERANHLRVNGSPIDVRGDALDVARSMGVLGQVHARRVTMTERSQFIDAHGTVVAELPVSEINDSEHDIEIPREDLAHILHEALIPTTPLVFGESIAELHDDGAGVDVTFASGRQDRFDLVIGADGMHSLTRRLTFGPESDYLKHLGFYVALTDLPAARQNGDRTSPFLNWPGHMIGIARYNDTALGVLSFRSDWIDYDYHDLDAQKQILLDAFAGHDEWRVPEILDAVRNDPELYFDSVSQIHMSTWHRGRVVLVGDAAHCTSNLSGRGASLAITGTWLLAQALHNHPADLEAAFEEYENNQRPYVTRAQDSVGPGGDLIMPATQEALDARNERLRAMTRG